MQLVRDGNGITKGSIRTPWVDVPTARTSGIASGDSVMAQLFGTGEPFDGEVLRRLYPQGVGDYVARFTAALDTAIRGKFVCSADRREILALASATYPGVTAVG